MFDWRDYGKGIFAFDAHYLRPLLVAVHMLVEKGRVAFIDTGSKDALPNAQAALARLGLKASAVDWIILTHIHLDHAGAAGHMMQAFPNARLVVHPRGAWHMVQPAKLVAGVTAVYGADYVKRMYGDILPVDPARIVEATDGHVINHAGRKLHCLDTPGHARHHNCIVDHKTGGIFTGDMFGMSFRELDVDGRQFLFPTTSPSQFDPAASRQSIQRLLDTSPSAMYLTHYGRLHDVATQARKLVGHIDALEGMARSAQSARSAATPEARHAQTKAEMQDYLFTALRAHGCQQTDSELLELWDADLELNTQGLLQWAAAAPAG